MNARNLNPGNPADLERNGESIRADMDETLEQLQEKLSPGRAMDRSLQFLRDHGGEISHEIGSAVREHPVPLLLAAVGLTWFTTSMIRSRASSSDSSDVSDYEMSGPSDYGYEDEYDHDYGYGETETSEGLKGRARQMGRKASDKLHSAMDSARGRTQQVNSQLNGLIREQPLALGALALAAGAILGAVLPASEYERQTLKPLGDRAMARAQEAGQRSYDQVRSALRSDGEASTRTPNASA